MPELQDHLLGTSSEGRVMHAVARTGSRLIGDRFIAAYSADCLQMATGLGEVHKLLLVDEGQKRGAAEATIAGLIAQAEDNMRWASEMHAEDYHRVNVLALLSLWAAFESGTENIIAAALGTVHFAAVSAAGKFPRGRYELRDWPWTDERCLEIAQKLDQKAESETLDGGWDVAARLTTLFAGIGANIAIPPETAKN